MAWAAVTVERDAQHSGCGAPGLYLHDKTKNSGVIMKGSAVEIELATGKVSQSGTGTDAAGFLVVGVCADSIQNSTADKYVKVWTKGEVWMKKTTPVQTDIGKLCYPDVATFPDTVTLTAPTNITGALGRITEIDATNGLVRVELDPGAVAAGHENA